MISTDDLEFTLEAVPIQELSVEKTDFPTNAAELKPRSLHSALWFKDEVENRCNATIESGQKWEGALQKYWVICAVGHRNHILASDIQQGNGCCKKCSNQAKRSTPDRLVATLAAQNALLEDGQEWRGTYHQKYWVICALGHRNHVRADHILQGRRCCKRCSNQAKRSTPDRLIAVLAAQNALLEDGQEWCGVDNQKYWIICAAGHRNYASANSILQEKGCCKRCADQAKMAAPDRLITALATQNAFLEDGQEWCGTNQKYWVVCSTGHRNYVWATSILRGEGCCKTCSYQAKMAAPDRLIAALAMQDAVLENGQEWRGVSNQKYWIICAAGHRNYVWANGILQGQGCCERCYIIHDVFYVVTRSNGSVKLGISSGDPRPRLKDHSRDGYTKVEFLRIGLPEGMALATEIRILDDLWDAGYRPELRREYFGPEAREFILELTETYLSEEKIKERREQTN